VILDASYLKVIISILRGTKGKLRAEYKSELQLSYGNGDNKVVL